MKELDEIMKIWPMYKVFMETEAELARNAAPELCQKDDTAWLYEEAKTLYDAADGHKE